MSRFGGNSKVYKCSLSWNLLITSVGVVGFGWDLVGDMADAPRCCPVKMSSIGDILRFGGNSKVYKCSLSWNLLITSVKVIGFWSNLVECMASVLWYCPVKMSSIRDMSRFGGNSKVYKCSLSWKTSVTLTDVVGFGWNLEKFMASMCWFRPVKMSKIWAVKKKMSSLLSVCFQLKSEFFWSLNNFSLSPWIPYKLGSSHSHYVYIQPCENGQNLRMSKNPSFFNSNPLSLSVNTLWVHKQQHSRIQPNLVRSTPGVCSFIPVNMS